MPAYHDYGYVVCNKELASNPAVRPPAWHGDSEVKDTHPTEEWRDGVLIPRAQVAQEWGMPWEPTVRPLYDKVTLDDGTETYEPYEDYKIIGRTDRPRARLTVTKETRELVYNHEMFECAEAFLSGTNVLFDTVGSADEGRKVYITCYLNEPWHAPNDPNASYPFLALINSHDVGGFRIVYLDFRVVCANTHQRADSQAERTGYTFRHTSNWRDRVEEAKLAIGSVREEVAEWHEEATAMGLIGTTYAQRREFVERFIALPVGEIVSDRVRSNVDEARGKWWSYLNGPTCEGIGETMLGLVQASGEYLDHGRGYRDKDTYVKRTLLRPEPLKGKAIRLAREVCGVGN